MFKKFNRVRQNEEIVAKHINELQEAVEANQISGDGFTTAVKQGPHGSTIRAFTNGSGSSGTALYPAKIKTKVDAYRYVADIYGNGIDQDPTIEDEGIRVLGAVEDSDISITGTDADYYPAWSQKWGDADHAESFWTIEQPRGSSGGGSATLIKVKSGGPGKDYIADVYGDGPDKDITAEDVTAVIPVFNDNETAVFTWYLATKVGEFYYFQPEIWRE